MTLANELEPIEKKLIEKLSALQIPGFVAECSPDEADLAGAFEEHALSEEVAWQSQLDLRREYDV